MKHKKITVLVVLLFLVCSTLFSASGARADQYGDAYLMQGDYGTRVTVLQQELKQLGYFQLAPTGYFGPITAAAVTALQADYGLAVDGIVGPATGALLQKLLANPPAGNNPPATGNTRTVTGYYTEDEGNIPSSYNDLVEHGDALTDIAPFWYQLDAGGSGSLHTLDGVSPTETEQVISTAHREKVKVFAMVYNTLYDSGVDGRDVTHRVLSDPNRRQALEDNIFHLLQDRGFDGVEIDMEDIYPADGQLFNQFIAELAARLHPAGYSISVDLPAKLSSQPNGSWADSFDYAGVGRYADRVVIMAYDEHGAYGGPGPIASLPWVEKVVTYALTCIPPQKIVLGLPAYGFDWNDNGTSPRYLSYNLAAQTAARYGAAISWSDGAQSPFFFYTDEYGSGHQVWFENASSWAGKLDLVNRYNLKGIAIWRLGMEDPASWSLIKQKFTVQK